MEQAAEIELLRGSDETGIGAPHCRPWLCVPHALSRNEGRLIAVALVLGPILRYVGETEATVWVEADEPCEVEVLGRFARTFEVAGHHYAIVVLTGLEPASTYEYRVALNGETVWPERGSAYPPSRIRTMGARGPVRVVVGSCRVANPHYPPFTLARSDHPEGRGTDALTALAEHVRSRAPEELPDLILHLGDQVYADEMPEEVRRYVETRSERRDAPDTEVVDFEEYTRLYRAAWGEPTMRWLLSTVPSAMVFDDHDVHDDWNTSDAWVARMRRLPWWEERITSAFMSYWVYQHAGNLSPHALAEDGLLDRLAGVRADAGPLLRRIAVDAADRPDARRWSYTRELGPATLLVIDSRACRCLNPGARDMLDAQSWTWLERTLHDASGHLMVATSLPLLLPHSFHHLEAWSEHICAGAWGRPGRALGERVRERLDLEHWAAFESSFGRLSGLLLAAAERPEVASVTCLSGDVHFGYVAELRRPGGVARVRQVVCSPMRNHLGASTRAAVRVACSGAAAAVGRTLARMAGAPAPEFRWRITQGPWFENHVGQLELSRERAQLQVEAAIPGRHPEMQRVLTARLDGDAGP